MTTLLKCCIRKEYNRAYGDGENAPPEMAMAVYSEVTLAIDLRYEWESDGGVLFPVANIISGDKPECRTYALEPTDDTEAAYDAVAANICYSKDWLDVSDKAYKIGLNKRRH